MVPVARRNLLAEKARLVISIAGVAFAVLLIAIVLALYRGMSKSGATIELLPGDLWVAQQGTVDPFHSVSLLTAAQVERLRSVDGVVAVIPVLARQMTFDAGGAEQRAYFMALAVPDTSPVTPQVRDQFLPPAGQVLIDRILSDKAGLSAGSRLTLGGQDLAIGNVADRSAEALSSFAFINVRDAQRAFGMTDTVNYAVLILAQGADPVRVAQQVQAADPGLTSFTRAGFATTIRKELDESFLPIIALLTGIGVVIGAAVVGLTIYTATIERSREYGVMKAVGASGGFLYRIVLSQSVMLTALGFVVGIVAAVGVARLARGAVPEFVTDFRWGDIVGILAAAAVMAVVASFVPVRRINGIDPAEVFRA